MTVIQQGQINTTALTVPDLYVQIVPPQLLINGLPTNILGMVGTATWGPVNSPTDIGNLTQYVQNFGNVQTNKYDLGTAVAAAVLQFASAMKCVRVTDSTDTAATAAVLDTTSAVSVTGINLTAYYTGSVGNTIVATIAQGSSYTVSIPTYKLTLARPGGVPEIFDNIGGTGAALWQNMANAVNLGQSGIRGPSQLAIASLGNGISAVNVTNAGSAYTSIPTVGFTGGSGTGVAASAVMKALTATVQAGGSGYAVNDTITLAGGTNTQPIVLTVSTVSSGAITAVTISTAGMYTALPANPASQATTSGVGTGGTFNITTWGVDSVKLTASGTGYTSAPTVTLTGGSGSGAAATSVVGSTAVPAISSYTMANGTDGITGVAPTNLLGVDTVPRKGMYALRNTNTSIAMLVDCDDSTTWSTQVSYGLSEGTYMIMVCPIGQSISAAITAKQNAGIDSYTAKLLLGDWCYFLDTFNNQLRLISPQGFIGGLLSALSPEQSSLNKQLYGIVGTQKSYANQTYSNADLQTLAAGGIDVITNPVPGGRYFGPRFGRNTSSNAVIHGDNYTRMTNYIAYTLNSAMGLYVGRLQSTQERLQAKTTLQTFLSNLEQQSMIGDVNGGPSYSVILDATNNPSSRVALGYQQADVKVVYLSVIEYFLINLEGGQSVQIQRLTTQPALQ